MNVQKYVLPSNGLLGYRKDVNIRAMQGREIATAYTSLSEASMEAIITAVIEPKIDIDLLTDEDKIFILHMTRIQTFGDTLTQTIRCPFCGNIHTYELSYSDFTVDRLENAEQVSGQLVLENNDVVTKQIPTTEIFAELNLYKEKHNLPIVDTYLLNMIARIKRIKTDTEVYTTTSELLHYLENAPGNIFTDIDDFIQTKFGLDPVYTVECNQCNTTLTGGLGITADLFRKPNHNV